MLASSVSLKGGLQYLACSKKSEWAKSVSSCRQINFLAILNSVALRLPSPISSLTISLFDVISFESITSPFSSIS